MRVDREKLIFPDVQMRDAIFNDHYSRVGLSQTKGYDVFPYLFLVIWSLQNALYNLSLWLLVVV